jgi:hypothetical protein
MAPPKRRALLPWNKLRESSENFNQGRPLRLGWRIRVDNGKEEVVVEWRMNFEEKQKEKGESYLLLKKVRLRIELISNCV